MKLINWIILGSFLGGCGDDLGKKSRAVLVENAPAEVVDDPTSSDAPEPDEEPIQTTTPDDEPNEPDTPNTPDTPTCAPTTSCATQGQVCGELSDGCELLNCGVCATNAECIDGQCVRLAEVGQACDTDDACLADLFCATGFPGGYCSKECATDSECGSQSHCADDHCFANTCSRPDYRLFDIDNDARLECIPQGGQGDGEVGDACDGGAMCGGGQFAFCGAWPDGYCMIRCGAGEGTCPTGSTCFEDSLGNATCMASCASDTDCRPGYGCGQSNDGTSNCVYVN